MCFWDESLVGCLTLRCSLDAHTHTIWLLSAYISHLCHHVNFLLLVIGSGICGIGIGIGICIWIVVDSNCKNYCVSNRKSNLKPHGKLQLVSNQEVNSIKVSCFTLIFLPANFKKCCQIPYSHFCWPVSFPTGNCCLCSCPNICAEYLDSDWGDQADDAEEIGTVRWWNCSLFQHYSIKIPKMLQILLSSAWFQPPHLFPKNDFFGEIDEPN